MRRAQIWIGVFVLMGLVAPGPADCGEDGASSFETTCAACHNPAKARELAKKYPSPEELDAYLATHFAKDAESRRKIIDFLRAGADAE